MTAFLLTSPVVGFALLFGGGWLLNKLTGGEASA